MSDSEDLLTKVREVFETVFGIDPQSVTMETTPAEISFWDSAGHLSLAASLEESFGISLDVDDLVEMTSVREIARIVNDKMKSATR